MESRGNLDLTMDGKNIGVEQVIILHIHFPWSRF
jgi:hypothetical protein